MSGIEVSDIESVRKRPGMYIGDTFTRGIQQLVLELVANTMDQVLANRARSISVDLDDDWVTVEDDGPGISVEPFKGEPFLEFILTHVSHEPTVDGHQPHVHITPQYTGAGLGVVSALSARIEIETRTDGTAWHAAFERGRCVAPLRSLGPTTATGTKIKMLPDEDIFDVRLDREMLHQRLSEIAWLMPSMTVRHQGQLLSKPGGLEAWVRELAPDVVATFSATRTIDDVKVDVAVGWSPTRNEVLNESFVNFTGTMGGTHDAALLESLRVSAAAPELWKACKNGFVFILALELIHPQFEGPTRTILASKEAKPAVQRALNDALANAPSFWEAIRTSRPSMA